MLIIIFFCFGVTAISGVAPGSYEINFKPGLEETFVFNFVFDGGTVSKLSVEGDLSEFVTLDKYRIVDSEKVVAKVNFPEKIENYGVNKIRISAKQVSGDVGGISITADVGGIIRVIVPYPGKYIETKLDIPDGSIEDLLNLSLTVKNMGSFAAVVKSQIQIFNGEKMIETLFFDENEIAPSDSLLLVRRINVSDFSVGEYGAVGLADYGAGFYSRSEDFFRLGKFLVKVGNYTKEIEKSSAAKFTVVVENMWNHEINNLYAEISVGGLEYSSPLINLSAWKSEELVFYLDSLKMD
ncbi:MAG: hypothetical protein Q8N88_00610, partial [Nanoarchaeota archaeon]|nr:hypothetical protein [Nanoarchaeota archaeon]